MSSIIYPAVQQIAELPRRFYIRAGFYFCLGWFLMSFLITLVVTTLALALWGSMLIMLLQHLQGVKL
jgi:hypothetical protein